MRRGLSILSVAAAYSELGTPHGECSDLVRTGYVVVPISCLDMIDLS